MVQCIDNAPKTRGVAGRKRRRRRKSEVYYKSTNGETLYQDCPELDFTSKGAVDVTPQEKPVPPSVSDRTSSFPWHENPTTNESVSQNKTNAAATQATPQSSSVTDSLSFQISVCSTEEKQKQEIEYLSDELRNLKKTVETLQKEKKEAFVQRNPFDLEDRESLPSSSSSKVTDLVRSPPRKLPHFSRCTGSNSTRPNGDDSQRKIDFEPHGESSGSNEPLQSPNKKGHNQTAIADVVELEIDSTGDALETDTVRMLREQLDAARVLSDKRMHTITTLEAEGQTNASNFAVELESVNATVAKLERENAQLQSDQKDSLRDLTAQHKTQLEKKLTKQTLDSERKQLQLMKKIHLEEKANLAKHDREVLLLRQDFQVQLDEIERVHLEEINVLRQAVQKWEMRAVRRKSRLDAIKEAGEERRISNGRSSPPRFDARRLAEKRTQHKPSQLEQIQSASPGYEPKRAKTRRKHDSPDKVRQIDTGESFVQRRSPRKRKISALTKSTETPDSLNKDNLQSRQPFAKKRSQTRQLTYDGTTLSLQTISRSGKRRTRLSLSSPDSQSDGDEAI